MLIEVFCQLTLLTIALIFDPDSAVTSGGTSQEKIFAAILAIVINAERFNRP